jgi:hypothetical protein
MLTRRSPVAGSGAAGIPHRAIRTLRAALLAAAAGSAPSDEECGVGLAYGLLISAWIETGTEDLDGTFGKLLHG